METELENETEMISHDGVVTGLSEKGIEVTLSSGAACASCHIKGSCGMSEGQEEKKFFVPSDSESYQMGENVKVLMSAGQGLKAVWYAYLLPFLVLMASLLVGLALFSEVWAGLFSIGLVAVYYLLVYVFQKDLNPIFKVNVKKD